MPTTTAVNVSSPAPGSTVTSPVHYVATAQTATCAGGVTSMGIYDNNSLIYSVSGASLNTSVTLANGAQHTVVQEWDYCGGSAYTTVNLTVGSAPTQTAVTVTSPAAGSTVTSPVQFAASATTATCSSGVAAMGIYVNGTLTYTANSPAVNTSLNLAVGPQHTVVQEWDHCGGSVYTIVDLTVQAAQPPSVVMTADSSTITAGGTSTLVVTGTNTTGNVTVTGSDGSSHTLPAAGGKISVSPASSATYTAEATSPAGMVSAAATVTVIPASSINAIKHVIFMLQENHTFDNYFGMLNPYRKTNGWNIGDDGKDYDIDGIDDKLNTISNKDDQGDHVCALQIQNDLRGRHELGVAGELWRRQPLGRSRRRAPSTWTGFVHIAEGFAKNCCKARAPAPGNFTDTTGERAMGYYDQDFLNYYYYMASAVRRLGSLVLAGLQQELANRIATFTGGTTQGLVARSRQRRSPAATEHHHHLPGTAMRPSVSWKIYYTVTQGYCLTTSDCSAANPETPNYPATTFSAAELLVSNICTRIRSGAACTAHDKAFECRRRFDELVLHRSQPHCSAVSQYYTDLTNGTLPSFAFIEAGLGQ